MEKRNVDSLDIIDLREYLKELEDICDDLSKSNTDLKNINLQNDYEYHELMGKYNNLEYEHDRLEGDFNDIQSELDNMNDIDELVDERVIDILNIDINDFTVYDEIKLKLLMSAFKIYSLEELEVLLNWKLSIGIIKK
jgi:predicted nuclease with TOPRIM domain